MKLGERTVAYGAPDHVREAAACRGHTDLFYLLEQPNQRRTLHITRERRRQIAQAKALCRTCPVLVDCHDWVMNGPADPDVGRCMIIAGMTPNERKERR